VGDGARWLAASPGLILGGPVDRPGVRWPEFASGHKQPRITVPQRLVQYHRPEMSAITHLFAGVPISDLDGVVRTIRSWPRTFCKRQATIEPVFTPTKFNRRIDRFPRRGRAACRSEWRLITATHNLLKLHTRQNVLTTA